MRVFYLSLWAALLVHASSWTNAAIDNGDSDMTKVNLTEHLINSDHMNPLNLRLHNNNLNTTSASSSAAMDTMTAIDLRNTLRLKDMLNVFDLNYIASQWINIRSEFSANCSTDIYKYLQGLSNSNMWSVKSEFNFCVFFFLLRNIKKLKK